MLRAAIFAAAVAVLPSVGETEELWSTDFLMQYCRNRPGGSAVQSYLRGFCSGMIYGVANTSPAICLPDRVTQDEAVRVVMRYVDARPRRRQESLLDLATEALATRWPCARSRRS